MVEQQQKLVLSPYMDIYELVIPKDNLPRQIKELVDFGSIYEELIDKYCLDNGRNAVPPARMSKYLLLKSVYETDESMKEQFPAKNTEDSLEKELEYCHALVSVIKEKENLCSYPKAEEKLDLLEESVKDGLGHPETSRDADAKTGHKTADTVFFGYKTHMAMSEERIITTATITSGGKTDGKELTELVRKSREAGQKRMNLNLIKTQGCTNARQGILQSINIWTDVKKKRRTRTCA